MSLKNVSPSKQVKNGSKKALVTNSESSGSDFDVSTDTSGELYENYSNRIVSKKGR